MGVEIPEDKLLAGKASSDAFANPVQEVLERGQAAVGRNINAHQRHPIPLDRDVTAATVEHNAGGAQRCCPGYGCQSIQIPDPVGHVRDAIRRSHHRDGDLALPDSPEEQLLLPSRPSQVTLEEPLEFIGSIPWPSSRPSTAASAVLPCVFAVAAGSWTGRFLLVFGGGGTCHPTHPVVDGSPE